MRCRAGSKHIKNFRWVWILRIIDSQKAISRLSIKLLYLSHHRQHFLQLLELIPAHTEGIFDGIWLLVLSVVFKLSANQLFELTYNKNLHILYHTSPVLNLFVQKNYHIYWRFVLLDAWRNKCSAASGIYAQNCPSCQQSFMAQTKIWNTYYIVSHLCIGVILFGRQTLAFMHRQRWGR